MGLDMYLTRRIHIANYEHNKKGQELTSKILDAFGIKNKLPYKNGSLEVSLPVAYWRKANAIHWWFVVNVQNGEDECRAHHVGKEKLKELRTLCQDILEGKQNKDALPPKEGFFFGNTTDDEYYHEDLRDTVKQLDAVLALEPLEGGYGEFYYRSSW